MGLPIESGSRDGVVREELRTEDSELSERLLKALVQLSPEYSVLSPRAKRASRAFTLVELLVVLAILAFLLSVAVPRYFGSLDRSKETVLKENLFQVRESLDQYFSDTGKYPDKIEDLVARHYLRSAPIDPVTGSTTTWLVVPPGELDKGGVFDIRSGAAGNGKDGTAYRNW
jgi:general secretion pathway protein G